MNYRFLESLMIKNQKKNSFLMVIAHQENGEVFGFVDGQKPSGKLFLDGHCPSKEGEDGH